MAESRSSRVRADLRAHSLLESQFDRRRFLRMLGGVAATAALAQLPAGRPTAAPQPRLDYPFTLGIASGDPHPDGKCRVSC
jgi:phosphodiesterase/alkaline phosphatase D-like protein